MLCFYYNFFSTYVCGIDNVQPYGRCNAGKDLIGLAQTGSGKTGAFALPILQALLEAPQAFFACVLSPTRFNTEL